MNELTRDGILDHLSDHWADEIEIVGSTTVGLVVDSFVSSKEPELIDGPGSSEFPIMELATSIIAICSVVTATVQVFEVMKKKDVSNISKTQIEDAVRSEVEKKIPNFAKKEMETIQYKSFLIKVIQKSDQ